MNVVMTCVHWYTFFIGPSMQNRQKKTVVKTAALLLAHMTCAFATDISSLKAVIILLVSVKQIVDI